jgi:hypothetical protein
MMQRQPRKRQPQQLTRQKTPQRLMSTRPRMPPRTPRMQRQRHLSKAFKAIEWKKPGAYAPGFFVG